MICAFGEHNAVELHSYAESLNCISKLRVCNLLEEQPPLMTSPSSPNMVSIFWSLLRRMVENCNGLPPHSRCAKRRGALPQQQSADWCSLCHCSGSRKRLHVGLGQLFRFPFFDVPSAGTYIIVTTVVILFHCLLPQWRGV